MLTEKITRPHYRSGTVYWLIVKDEPDYEVNSAEILTVELYAKKRALAIFSFEEEAQMFARLVEDNVDWHVSEIKDEDLLELLYSSSQSTEFIALDPFPEWIASESANLVSVSGEYFALCLLWKIQQNEDIASR